MFMCEVPRNRRVCGSNTEIHRKTFIARVRNGGPYRNNN